MLAYPQINPIALSFGPLKIHWYGLMYLFGFITTWLLGVYRIKTPWATIKTREQVADAIFYGALGVILGGRIGYVLFYNAAYYFQHPGLIIAVWDGGMSFHGGLIGVILAMWWYSHRLHISIFDLLCCFAEIIDVSLSTN